VKIIIYSLAKKGGIGENISKINSWRRKASISSEKQLIMAKRHHRENIERRGGVKIMQYQAYVSWHQPCGFASAGING
jgi:hypothetical protein